MRQRTFPTNSIAPYGAVSLTTSDWTLRHRETWDEKHHEFFSQCGAFYRDTMPKAAAASNAKNRQPSRVIHLESWVLESKNEVPCGRIQLQLIAGDFNLALIFIDLVPYPVHIDPAPALSQLITSQFLALTLDSLKIIPLNQLTADCLINFLDKPPSRILSFSQQWLPEVSSPTVYSYDQTQWLSSKAGEEALANLSWLQKRVERIQKSQKMESTESKRPWLVNILAMGRGRRRSEKMIHPIDRMKNRRT